MRNRKVKIPQYLVRGKHRDFHVLVFPRLKHTWAYYDSDSEHYAIDADIVGCKWLRFAMASLIAAPDKIVYFQSARKPVSMGTISPTTIPFSHGQNCSCGGANGSDFAVN